MPFNIADTIKQALNVPVQQGINDASQTVGEVISQTESAPSLITSNYGIPSSAQKAGEAIDKVVNQGNAKNFNSITQQVKMVYENNQIAIKEASTNRLLGKVGQKDPPHPPANFLNSKKTPPMSEMKVTITQEPFGFMDVVFDVMPTIDEGRSAQYDPFSPLHHPGEILKYKSTSSRSWTVNGRLISRNVEEATKNLMMVNTIRTWVMPYYGEGTKRTDPYLLGAPPPILTLTAYGKNMIGPVKCVLESYSISWPNDVDYLPATDADTGENRPFPVVLNVTVNLKEAWSPAEYSGFSIRDYQFGNMPLAFSAINRTGQDKKPQTSVMSETNPSSLDTSQPANINVEENNDINIPSESFNPEAPSTF
jgi:hypothetical protein